MEAMYDKILGKLREGEDTSGYAEKATTPQILTVSNINALTSAQCASLKAGDVVVANNGSIKVTYVVSSKLSSVMYLQGIYGDNKSLFCVKYQLTNNAWAYYGRTIIPILEKLESELPAAGMQPDVFYNLGELAEANFTLAPAPDDGYTHTYHWAFVRKGNGVISLPQDIERWIGGYPPYDENGVWGHKYYELFVCNGVGWWRSDRDSFARFVEIDNGYSVHTQPLFEYGAMSGGNAWWDLSPLGGLMGSFGYYGTHTFHDGLILAAPNNSLYKLKVANDGTLSTELVS